MSFLSFSEVASLQISKYANIGSLAILIYDYCITFHDEVQWTWSRPWDLVRAIFIVSRYLPFVGAGMTAYAALRVNSSCPPSLEENIIHILCIIAAEGLLLLRTWAFWQKSRILLIGLLSYGLLTIVAATFVNLTNQLSSGGSSLSLRASAEVVFIECPFVASKSGALVYAFLAAYETVILILTVYKRFYDYRDFKNSIINMIYHDGMVYILCIIAITVANIVVVAAFPIYCGEIFDTLQIALHSVLASRILFRLRSSTERVYEMPTELSESIHDQRLSDLWTAG